MAIVLNATAADRVKGFLKEAFTRDQANYGTQADLARQLGKTPSAVSAWKRGISVPEEELWEAIAMHLGYAPDAIAVVASGRAPTLSKRPRATPADRSDGVTLPALARRLAELEARVAQLEGARVPRSELGLAASANGAVDEEAIRKAPRRHKPSPPVEAD